MYSKVLVRMLTAAATVALATAAGLAVAQSVHRAEPRVETPRWCRCSTTRPPPASFITTEQLRASGFSAAVIAQGAGSAFVRDTAPPSRGDQPPYTRRCAARVRPARCDRRDRGPGRWRGARARPRSGQAGERAGRARRPVPPGTSGELRIGQAVYAIGTPFGLQRTLTPGIVGALDRERPTTEFRDVAGVIPTDAAINPGSSGGPLLDSVGRLIGVNTAIHCASGSAAGVGFAMPVDLLDRIVPVLNARGRAPRYRALGSRRCGPTWSTVRASTGW